MIRMDDKIIMTCMGCKYFVIIRNNREKYMYCKNDKRWQDLYGYYKDGGLIYFVEYNFLGAKEYEKIKDKKFDENCKYKEVLK